MWKNIIGFENFYMINEYGDIYSLRYHSLMKPYINNKGYKCIDLSGHGYGKSKYLVHRLVAIHFVENPNNLPIVLHIDNNKLNTYYKNLKWGTYSENNAQAIRDGLNSVPRPDNRKRYDIYNDTTKITCCGIKEVIEKTDLNSESNIQNIIRRRSRISNGPYKGYMIKKVISPIYFNN